MALTQFEVNSMENIKYSLARIAVALEEISKELKKLNENKNKNSSEISK